MASGRNPLAIDFGGSHAAPASDASEAPLSVSDAVETVKNNVKSLPTLMVAGEVSGFRGPNARSGHCYFQVKDDTSSMDVIVWRNTYASMGTQLRDGLSVVLTGKFDVYVGTGKLSFIARSVELAGEGLLRQQVEALAKKLAAEGLMDERRKRPIPRFCTRVAVVTSLSGSVIDDVKRTLRRRNPLVELDVVGCAVQGPGAPQTIMRALQVAANARPEAILLVRGGGSFEDLMTFNDESLARAVADCPVPVITGIGHEPDTSICDMVSDRRCSTPTAAAESVAPAIDEVVSVVEARRQRMGIALGKMLSTEQLRTQGLQDRATHAMQGMLGKERSLLEAMARRRCLENPLGFVEERQTQLLQSEQRLHDAMPRVLDRERRMTNLYADRMRVAGESLVRPHQATMARMAASLDALSPLKVLARGYAIARDEQGHVVSNAADLAINGTVNVVLGKGSFDALVTDVHTEE